MKIYLDMVGCRLNQSEIEQMAQCFRRAGHSLVPSASEADLMVINTCTVTAAADVDSRKKIRQAARQGVSHIVATGCLASLRPEEINRLPGVKLVVPNRDKEQLVELVLGKSFLAGEKKVARVAIPGERRRSRAFIKAQDGCDNHCTYCITRVAREQSKSRPESEIFYDVESALLGGVQEIVLTGVNLGAWGKDLTSSSSTLASLIHALVERFSPPRLRLSSLECWDVSQELIETFTLPGVCRYIHLPLQSGCEEILKKMGRKARKDVFQEAVENLRLKVPEIAITTDMIVAFPGETEDFFQESLAYIRKMAFSNGHVFRFSARPGTPAADLSGRVAPLESKKRSKRMREEFSVLAAEYRASFINESLPVLWEKSTPNANGWQLEGLSDNFLRITAPSHNDLYNQISLVRIQHAQADKLSGCLTVDKN